MADTRDMLTLAEAKRTLRIGPTDTSEDVILAEYVTAASRVMDHYFGNTVALTVTNEAHNSLAGPSLVLNQRPVISISSVVEYQEHVAVTLSAESAVTAADDGFIAERYPPDPALYSGILRRRAYGYDGHWHYGRGNVLVTYVSGRVATTALVDARFKRACAFVLANMWRDREPGLESQGEFDVPRSSFPSFAVPNIVRQMLPQEYGQHEPAGIA